MEREVVEMEGWREGLSLLVAHIDDCFGELLATGLVPDQFGVLVVR